MKSSDLHHVQFNDFSRGYARFEEDFYRYGNPDAPVTFFIDDILSYLHHTGKNYFRLSGPHSKDGQDHYFYFRRRSHPHQKEVVIYEYLGHRFPWEPDSPG